MRRQARYRPWIVVSALALLPGVAAAEDAVKPYPACGKSPTEGDVAAAKGAFQAGTAAFNEADYDRAITYWEDAYRRDCTAHPNLLNLARAYELNGQKGHAANALETFLLRSPGAADDGQIRRRIDKLREEMPPAQAETHEDKPVVPPPVAAPPPTPPEEPPPSSTGKRSIIPLIVAGVGGAVAIGGTIAYASARSDYSTAHDACPIQDDCTDPNVIEAGNDARTRSVVAGWIAGAGGVVLVGGVVWYFVQPTTRARSGFLTRVTPAFGAGYGGVEVNGRF